MDIEILEEFTSLYETLSFQETADRMNISQSALTKHIHKLEEDLGVNLFDRSTRSVRPNEYSETFYSYADQIVRTAKEGRSALQDISEHNESRLRLAFTNICSNYGIIELISTFAKMHPEYHVDITESFRACDLVVRKQCDFAFANDVIPIDERLAKVVYKEDHLAIFVSSDLIPVNSGPVSIASLKDRFFVMHSRSNGAYHQDSLMFQAACRAVGFEPRVSAKASYTSSILKLVREGQGIAVLFRGQLPEDQRDPRIAVIDIDPAISTRVYLTYDPKQKKSPARRAFLNYLLQYEQLEE